MKGLTLIAATLVVFLLAIYFQQHITTIISWIQSLGLLAPIFFLVIYALATVLFLPTMAMTFAGGMLFGPIFGTCYNVTGATLGAVIAFLIGRHFGLERIMRDNSPKVSLVLQKIEAKGWLSVALVRLFPLAPFNLVNYAFGATTIKFSHYALATFLFLIPAEIIYTSFGSSSLTLLNRYGGLYKDVSVYLLGLVILCYLLLRVFFAKSRNVMDK